ncbi:MAG TPA: HAD-IB family hydrolase [Acidimicrobiales bacterium]|nr:HAD-IB family hydrolase [Acidimicrobiales bacterium]
MIEQALAGRRVGITGSTGFLGTALVERLLRSVPDCTLVLLVRGGRRGAAERVRREILRNDCFDRLRGEWGERFDAEVARRVAVVDGDVGTDGLGLSDDDRALFTSCDVVVHSAAAVSFDSPLDSAVEVNLLGPTRVARVLGADTHLVAVSTAYVAGTRRGDAPEALLPDTPFATEVDWRAEVDAARRARADADADSRRPERLARFTKQARSELGAAGSPLLAERSEKLRLEWIADHMVEAGRARAQALGWPDAYAYTKALGERALLQERGDTPVTTVRPSIIESALAEPRPGWIRGFRMAEPVIISYGRGLLKEFPGIPEGVVDVIPVDLVVAAIIAVAARGPEDTPSVYQVASGSRNPLRYRQLVDLVREWFTANPLYDTEGQPIVVPEWSFPGRGRVQRQLERATKVLAQAEKVVSALPVRGRKAELSAQFEERRGQAERALGYVQLYGAYTETEALFRVDRLITLWDEIPISDRETFCFDPAAVDWRTYVHDIHLPSIVVHARVRTTAGRKEGPSRSERGRRAVLSPDRHLAAFDLENTLIASNVVESYSWLATRRLDVDERVRFTLRTLREAPALLALDRRDRGDFLRHFYRRYEGAPAETLRGDAWELFSGLILTKSFPAGLRRVREHRALGHRTVLITGALDFVVEPLRPLFDEIVCARLGETVDGRLTGELLAGPPTGEARALVLRDYAEAEGLRLEESVAYADSASDLPMLEAVGHPVAVNPEAKLAAIARKRGWHVEQWSKAPGGPRPLLPMGRVASRGSGLSFAPPAARMTGQNVGEAGR